VSTQPPTEIALRRMPQRSQQPPVRPIDLREPRFVRDFAAVLGEIGPTAFNREFRRAVLVGYGLTGEVTDRPRQWSRRTLPMQQLDDLKAVRSITDRVWAIRKDPGSPRGPNVLLGASHGVDVVVTDYSISTRHCAFSFEPGRLLIADLGSLNGTFVNGERLEPEVERPLIDREPICMGRIKLQYLARESFFQLVKMHLEGRR
jgi:FHA domain